VIALGALAIFVGFIGCLASLTHTKGTLATYAFIVTTLLIIQSVVGGILLTQAAQEDHLREYGSRVWTVLTNDQRNAFQRSHQCVGYLVPNDRPGSMMQMMDLGSSCAPAMMSIVRSWMHGFGAYLFLTVFLELLAVVTSFVLVRDNIQLSGYRFVYVS
jgi:hypothetical protein